MRVKRFFKFFGLSVAILIMSVLVAGQIANYTIPVIEPPGKIYSINGKNMHLYCTGSENNESPTVIIIAGLGVQSPLYYNLQEELSKSVHVCTYDRAGNGWSDPNDTSANVKNMSEELYQLLNAAKIEGPLILAGHSLGGAVSLIHSDKYQDQVAGIAFIDSTHYNQYNYFGQEYNDEIYHKHNELMSTFWIEESIVKSGVLTLLGGLVNGSSVESDEDVQKMYMYFFASNPPFDSIRSEVNSLEESLEQTKLSHYFRGDLPIVSMSASDMDFSNFPDVNLSENERRDTHIQFGRDLAELSNNGIHVIVEDTDHMSIIQSKETADHILSLIQSTVE